MKNDGGAAFPRPASEFTKDGTLQDGNDAIPAQKGMTLRDYFAAKAMPFMLQFDNVDGKTATFEEIARESYQLADAMLAEREK